jgi:uncharacterized membrane protein
MADAQIHKPDRFVLLDVMRAFAAFMMVQGHTVDALLAKEYYDPSSIFYFIWIFGRGLTAPIFLFGSGFAYVLANTARSRNGRLPAEVIRKRLRWILALFLLGALMHFPVPFGSMIASASAEQWNTLLRVDILRMMAVSLLLLLGLYLVCGTHNSLLAGSAGAMAFFVLFAPPVYSIHWPAFMHPSVAGFLSRESGSYFPLFPFAGYLFAGSTAGKLYVRWKANGTDRRLVPRFALAAILCIGAAIGWQEIAEHGGGFSDDSPFFFLLRLGFVLLFWSGFGALLRSVGRMPRIVLLAGQHTLLIYVFHVTLLYGCAWYLGLQHFCGKALSIPSVTGVIVAILAASAAVAYGMHELRARSFKFYHALPYAAGAVLLLLFLIF